MSSPPYQSQNSQHYSIVNRFETSAPGASALIDQLVDKSKNAASDLFSSREEFSGEYLRIKEQQLELNEQARREQMQLERLTLAQSKELKELRLGHQREELMLQREIFQFKQQQKWIKTSYSTMNPMTTE
ncbi:hypothetical protein Tco_1402161 [Tanacetum coccineum]